MSKYMERVQQKQIFNRYTRSKNEVLIFRSAIILDLNSKLIKYKFFVTYYDKFIIFIRKQTNTGLL